MVDGFVAAALPAVPLVVAGFDAVTVGVLRWVALFAYEVVAIGAFGRTLGTALVSARVVRAADGRRPGWTAAIARWILPTTVGVVAVLSSAWVALLFVPIFLPVFLSGRQGLHDRIARTAVVSELR